MIARIDTRGYDVEGRATLLPEKKSLHFRPTAAMGTYLSGELQVRLETLEELQGFLRSCRYVSDPEQFGVRDYWAHPSEFERTRKGDCDCFSLYAWRQLVEMGYEARFVIGRAGYGRRCHAWVTFLSGDIWFLLEPVAARRRELSRLATMMYEPTLSVSWDGKRCRYHQHRPRDYEPTFTESLAIAFEWIPLFLSRWARRPFLWGWSKLRRAG